MRNVNNHIVPEGEKPMPQYKSVGYAGMVCEGGKKGALSVSPDERKDGAYALPFKSEGEKNGSVVGCNYDGNLASVRTANCNYGAGNSNSNYAGAFAVNINGVFLTSRAASLKTTDSHTATGGYGRCDYGSLPFLDSEDNAESNATATDKETVTEELKTANSKRKLKNLKRFFLNRHLIEYAFDKTLKTASSAPALIERFAERKTEICNRIERELTDQTYTPLPCKRRIIQKKGKGEKDRNADVFSLYDRIIHTLILTVIEGKLRNMMPRNVYSGIRGRSLLSNDRRYCMVNRIRQWVKTHPDQWVGMTDIRRFYETLRMRVVLGEMFRIVVCPYTRWLLVTAFSKTEYLPIGGSLSQIMAMLTIVSADRAMLERYNVELFCFGDNRLICGERQEVRRAMSFLMSYYPARYGLHVKNDYQMRKAADGFRFCKYEYKGSYVHVRAEIRRRAIRAFRKGRRHYAGYKGMLRKTDSRRLIYLIENHYMELVNKHGMTVTTQRGDKVKLRDLADGSEIVPVEFALEPSEAKRRDGKEGIMVRLTYIHILNGTKRLCHSTEGSEEVVGFFRLVADGKQPLHQRLHVKHDGTKVFFYEFHTTKEEACALICDMLGI